jgi:hypothetical protein
MYTHLLQGGSIACLLSTVALEKVMRDAQLEAESTLQILASAENIDLCGRRVSSVKEAFQML